MRKLEMNDRRIDEEYASANRRPHHNGRALPNPQTELVFGDGEIVAIAALPTENELMAALILNPAFLRPELYLGQRRAF